MLLGKYNFQTSFSNLQVYLIFSLGWTVCVLLGTVVYLKCIGFECLIQLYSAVKKSIWHLKEHSIFF